MEAVYVALPNALHHRWVVAALRAGKHVLCEKPLATSIAEVDDIVAASRTADRQVMEGFMYRFHPQYESYRWEPLLRQLGPIRHAYPHFSVPQADTADIRRALGGGAFWDLGCYCLNLLIWLLGDVVGGDGHLRVRGEVDVSGSAALRFSGGATGTASWSFESPFSEGPTPHGTAGHLDLDLPFLARGGRRRTPAFGPRRTATGRR